MSTLELEVKELRKGLEELRDRLSGQKAYDPLHVDFVDAFVKQLTAGLARDGHPNGSGVLRTVVLPGGNGHNVWSSNYSFGDVSRLPSEADMVAFAASLGGSPIATRALRRLAERVFSDEPLQMRKSELAGALQVSEADLEAVLLPLVGNNTLSWGKTSDGSEYYRLEAVDKFYTFLTLV